MPLIDPTLIEQLKRNTDLAGYIAARGILLSKNGKNHKGLCPFHEETEPSFTVNPAENLWHCFGCNAGGDIFNFIERVDKLSFTSAVKKLNRDLNREGIKLVAPQPSIRAEAHPSPSPALTAKHYKLLNRIVHFYQQELWKDRRGLNYLKSRGITDRQSLIDFGVGFVTGNLLEILPSDDDWESALKQIGILNERGHEMFYGCVVFPLLDFNNPSTGSGQANTVGLYGRRIDEEQVAHLYLPGPRRGLINRQAAKRSKTLLLTESIIDALSLYENGFKNVIPIYGVNGWIEDHTKLIQEYKPETLYLCFDSDEAGMKASHLIKEKLRSMKEETLRQSSGQAGIRIKTPVVKLPVKDINDYFKKYRAEEFEKLLQEANPQSVEASEVHQIRDERFYEKTEYGFHVAYGKREYEIKGIARVGTQLKATIKASLDLKGGGKFQITTIDLYSLRSKEWFAKVVSELTCERTELVLEDLNRILTRIESHQTDNKEEKKKTLSPAEIKEAKDFLENPKLFSEILSDLEVLGCTGEETNKLVAYLVAVSRKTEEPLSLLLQSRSAAGKSTLQDAILSLVPEEDYVKYTRLTDQALFYKDENSLVNKILALEEAAGIGGSAYSIRAMQSAKQLTVATTSKDQSTGKMKTEEYQVNGPLAIMLTTTEIELDSEMENRFLSLSIDESQEMTEKIHQKQREQDTLEGYLRKKKSERLVVKHQNAQRILKPLAVVNPYAPYLHFPSDNLRSRRDHKKYLNLMKAIAFIHQYQRPVKKTYVGKECINYIEVTLEDIAKANKLANEVLGKSLDDLSAPSRTLLNLIHKMVMEETKKYNIHPKDFSFNRRIIREYAKWSEWQVRAHINELEELGYVYGRMGSKGKEYVYEVHAPDNVKPDQKIYLGLTDVSHLEKMRSNFEGKKLNLVG